MPRDGSGVYTLPLPNVISNDLITTSWANTTLNDLGSEITTSLPRTGTAPMTGALRLTDGGVGAPALSFNSEATSGVYRSGTNEVAVAVGGVLRLKVKAAGVDVVGALAVGSALAVTGATTLNSTLNVTGATTLSALSATSLTLSGALTGVTDLTTTGNTVLGDAVGDTLSVAGGTLALNADGNVGLNTTPSAWASSIDAIDIGTFGSFSSGAGAVRMVSNAYYDGTNWKYKTTNPATLVNAETGTGGFAVYTAASGTAGTNVTFNERLRILTDGTGASVGIGYSPNAGYALDMYRSGASTSMRINTDAGFQSSVEFAYGGNLKGVIGSTGTASGIINGSAAGDVCVRANSSNMLFSTNNGSSAALKISSGGVLTEISGYEIGYRVVPRTTSAGGTANISMRGLCTSTTGGITVPASTFAAGDCFSIYNNSASALTITQGSGLTMYGNAAATGNRTLAARGMCTVWFESATVCKITGEVT